MNLLVRLVTSFDASLVALAYWLIALLCASILIVGHVNPPILQHGWSTRHVHIPGHTTQGPNGELRT